MLETGLSRLSAVANTLKGHICGPVSPIEGSPGVLNAAVKMKWSRVCVVCDGAKT